MRHDLGERVGVQRVQDIEEVVARRPFASGVGVGEVGHELRVLDEHRVDRLVRQLVVFRHLYDKTHSKIN